MGTCKEYVEIDAQTILPTAPSHETESHQDFDLPEPIAALRFRIEQEWLRPKDRIPYIGSKARFWTF